MQANYEHFIERMIGRYEGGYGWDRADPGGPTKYGITCYDLAEYYGEKMTSMASWAPRVRAMPLSVADEIYRKKYATACRFDDLVSGSDCVVLDFGVNSGPSRSIKFSQRIAHTDQDGILGPVTLAAINGMAPTQFIDALCDARLAFLHSLGTWPRYGRGWSSRVADLRAYAKALLLPAPEVAEAEYAKKPQRVAFAFAKGYEAASA
jgi:lysozyme family protein